MKRKIPTPNSSALIRFVDITRPLLQETERLISIDCNQVVIQIPNEVWKEVFLSMLLQDKSNEQRLNSEKECRMMACVSFSFSIIIQELVRSNFTLFEITNWSLRKYQDIKILCLYRDEEISDETFMLTNVKRLTISSSHENITPYGISNLANLKELNYLVRLQ
jgi:hypothetical protein